MLAPLNWRKWRDGGLRLVSAYLLLCLSTSFLSPSLFFLSGSNQPRWRSHFFDRRLASGTMQRIEKTARGNRGRTRGSRRACYRYQEPCLISYHTIPEPSVLPKVSLVCVFSGMDPAQASSRDPVKLYAEVNRWLTLLVPPWFSSFHRYENHDHWPWPRSMRTEGAGLPLGPLL